MAPFTKAANRATPASTTMAVSRAGISGYSRLPASSHLARGTIAQGVTVPEDAQGLFLIAGRKHPIRIRDLAARCARVVLERSVPSANRGRREDRVRAAPAVSCAICTSKCAHEHTGEA